VAVALLLLLLLLLLLVCDALLLLGDKSLRPYSRTEVKASTVGHCRVGEGLGGGGVERCEEGRDEGCREVVD
jgi:hypothetical protein